jgi:hypothetical protein
MTRRFSFSDLETDVRCLSRAILLEENVEIDRLERARVIDTSLNEALGLEQALKIDWFPFEFEEQFHKLRRELNNISLTEAQLSKSREQFVAAVKLSIAYGTVMEAFAVNETDDFMSSLFGFDVDNERARDSLVCDELRETLNKPETTLATYAFGGGIALSIAVVDTASGADGMATAIFGLGGIVAIIASYVVWKDRKQAKSRILAFEAKWNYPAVYGGAVAFSSSTKR